MVRLRLPGGRIEASVLRRLAELATSYGNGVLQLTSRAGLQLRGLPDPLPAAFVDEITATGVLPTASHERVRNIVTSPLTSLLGGLTDLTSLTSTLDAGLIAVPELADLPGRFLFVLDDGRGDVVDLTFDLGYQATGPTDGVVLVGSADRGLPVGVDEAVETLLELAQRFTAARAATGAWHVTDLPDWIESLDLDPVEPVRGTPAVPLGRLGGAASVGVPLARLTLAQTQLVEQLVTAGPVVVSPWRGLVLPGTGDCLGSLERAGFVVDEDSVWAQLSACVGAPFCTRAQIDTTAMAAALVASGDDLPRTHLSGCERRCGAPTAEHVDLVAPTLTEALRATRSEVAADE
jgi:precorrin-3B synthase